MTPKTIVQSSSKINVGVAAFGVITVISLVVVAIYTGLSQGVQPVISTSYGKGDWAAVKALHRYAMFAVVFLSCAIYSAIYFHAPQLAAVFNTEQNATLQSLAVTGLKLYFLACPFIGYNIVTATYFTSTENARPAQIISLLLLFRGAARNNDNTSFMAMLYNKAYFRRFGRKKCAAFVAFLAWL